MCSNGFLLAILAVLFPPLPVWVLRGLCSADSFINIALCMLGVIPGLLHSWYIIANTPDEYEYQQVADPERNNASVYYVQMPGQHGGGVPQPQLRDEGRSYGTVGGQSSSAGATNDQAPPAYTDAIKGDNKVQK